MSRRSVEILDTTLRDGAQAEGISFSVNDKFQVVETLAALGVRYIEAGNPGSNPKDRAFYNRFQTEPPKMDQSLLAAFGSTRRKHTDVAQDPRLRDLLDAGTPVIVLFGKVWDLEVRDILKCSHKENIAMIRESVAWCCSQGREVIFDAEHYFEASLANEEYALRCLEAACEGGASVVCLCDTNGASMPELISEKTRKAVDTLTDVRVGIHCHNDAGLAVANSIAGVLAGASHVQGTLNGIGERCGNANLSTIIANLQLKYDISCIPEDRLDQLTPLTRKMADVANLTLPNGEPYVGLSAFSHKGGMHVDGVKKNPITFEHIDPRTVGNNRRFLLSEVSGRSAVLDIIRKVKPDIGRDAPEVGQVLQKLKEMEHQGYQYEGAEASLALLICKELGLYQPFFKLEKLRIASEQPRSGTVSAYAFIKIFVDGVGEATAAEGEGPVNAMDQALKRAMQVFYPELTHVRLTDYKVRVLTAEATASQVRTLIESTDGRQIWNTVGVSNDILEASWQALVDSLEYQLMRRQLAWED